MALLDTLFNSLESSTADDGKKTVDVLSHPTVPWQDREPFSIIQSDATNGPWVAGGACLRWYQNQPVSDSDIDIFCKNAKQAAEVIERIKSYGRYVVKFTSENATTLQYRSPASDPVPTQWIMQVITKRYFESMEEVISSFDLSVCQIATDGEQWVLGDYTARDIREKNLRMQDVLHADAVKRLVKYWVYGYRPVEGLLDRIKDNPESRWAFEGGEDYR